MAGMREPIECVGKAGGQTPRRNVDVDLLGNL